MPAYPRTQMQKLQHLLGVAFLSFGALCTSACLEILGLDEYREGAGGGGTTTTASHASSSTTSSSSSGTPTSSTSSGAAECTPPLAETCYSGAAGTDGIGTCRGGSRDCEASGHWGPCVGEVVPTTEDCQTNADESCSPNCGEYLAHRTFFSEAEEYIDQLFVLNNGDLLLVGNAGPGSGLDFGGGPLTVPDDYQIVLARLTSSFEHVWSKTYPIVPVRAVAAPTSLVGIAAIAGFDVTIGGTSFVGGDRMFVRVSEADGNVVSAVKSTYIPYALGVDPNGYFFEAARSGTSDVVIRRSGAGVDQTVALWPTSSQIHITGVEGFSGGVFVYGYFEGTLTTGGFSVSTAQTDGFVLKIVNGAPAALVQLHASGSARVRGAAFRQGDLYVVGDFTGSLPDPLSGASALSQAGSDFYVARFQSAGSGLSLTWAKGFPGAGDALPGPTTVDGQGFVTTVVRVGGDSDFGGGVIAAAGSNTRILASYKSDGSHSWSRALSVWPSAIAADASNRLVVGGLYSPSAAPDAAAKNFFGSGVDLAGSMSGSEDVFLAQLVPASP